MKCGFKDTALPLPQMASTPVSCGCTMAVVIIRLESRLVLGDSPDSKQVPDTSEITWFVLGSHSRVSLKVRRGSRFIFGTVTFVMELLDQKARTFFARRHRSRVQPDSQFEPSDDSERPALGRVRLQPEYFQLDWLHEDRKGRAEDLHDLQKDASNLLTALLHKGQRTRKFESSYT